DGEYRMRASSVASRSRTRGWQTATGPMPVMISRCGRWPLPTPRSWSAFVFRSLCFARNSATSASTAWVSSARAPLRRISVRESVKAPGWASLMTLLSDTAYHSFIGEVEALNTTTIRRLTQSRRHQLLAIAPDTRFQPSREYCPWLGFNRSDSGGPRSGNLGQIGANGLRKRSLCGSSPTTSFSLGSHIVDLCRKLALHLVHRR